MNVFDEEMAEATARTFFKIHNQEKRQFIIHFKSIWENMKYEQYIKVEDTMKGFKKLLSLLEEKRKFFQGENMVIADRHTYDFIEIIKFLIKENIKDKCFEN